MLSAPTRSIFHFLANLTKEAISGLRHWCDKRKQNQLKDNLVIKLRQLFFIRGKNKIVYKKIDSTEISSILQHSGNLKVSLCLITWKSLQLQIKLKCNQRKLYGLSFYRGANYFKVFASLTHFFSKDKVLKIVENHSMVPKDSFFNLFVIWSQLFTIHKKITFKIKLTFSVLWTSGSTWGGIIAGVLQHLNFSRIGSTTKSIF